MRLFVLFAALPLAFVAGMFANQSRNAAQAAAPVLSPAIIDLTALTDAQIGPMVPNVGTIRSKLLVATPNGTISVQSGNAPKHIHLEANEIQYIIAGTGTFWLGDKQEQIHPGDLIIIPKGTPHAGSIATDGEFRALAIKLPPQQKGDMHMVN
jgi:quercetin dioxygenase-like cupin family protein